MLTFEPPEVEAGLRASRVTAGSGVMVGFPRLRLPVFLGLAAVGLVLLLLARGVDLGRQIERCVGFFREAGPLPFFAAMALLPAIGFPIWPFTVAAGPVFGPTLGVTNVVLCAVLAITVNVALCYWISARALRPWIERLLSRMGYGVPRIPPGAEWDVTLLVRLIPGPPLFLQSYLLGVARVPFAIYMIVSVAVHVAFVAGTILTGDALMRGDARGLVFGGVLCAAGTIAGYRLRRRLKATQTV